MYKIRRVNITDVFLLCRCYGSQRNQPNHYETLCVQNNSSQKEIREAFIKLSKELHPDIRSKGSHAEFVKVNEAYKILSKDCSRRQHDIDLKSGSATQHRGEAFRYSDRAYYHDPVDFKSRTNKMEVEYETNYYGIKGVKRVSNGTIVVLCVLVCLLIVSFEMTAFRHSVQKSQRYMKNRSLQVEQDYEEIRTAAYSMTRDEQIAALQKKLDTQKHQYDLGENNRMEK